MAEPQPEYPIVSHERRPATQAEAKALGSAVRLRILRLCLDEALTNREIATELELNPATSLHHVRTLSDTGFLVPLEPRRGKRGSREIPYRATGKSWNIDGGNITNPILEASMAELDASPSDQRSLWRMAFRLPQADIDKLDSRITELIEEYRSRPSDPGAEQWALFVALHPGGRHQSPEADA